LSGPAPAISCPRMSRNGGKSECREGRSPRPFTLRYTEIYGTASTTSNFPAAIFFSRNRRTKTIVATVAVPSSPGKTWYLQIVANVLFRQKENQPLFTKDCRYTGHIPSCGRSNLHCAAVVFQSRATRFHHAWTCRHRLREEIRLSHLPALRFLQWCDKLYEQIRPILDTFLQSFGRSSLSLGQRDRLPFYRWGYSIFS